MIHYHLRTDDGWSEPLTYDQAVEFLPERTEAEWQRIETLEATIGRTHEDAR